MLNFLILINQEKKYKYQIKIVKLITSYLIRGMFNFIFFLSKKRFKKFDPKKVKLCSTCVILIFKYNHI